MAPRTILFKLYSLLQTTDRKDFENRMKNIKVTAKGLFLTLAPADHLFHRIVYLKPFPVCALWVSLHS